MVTFFVPGIPQPGGSKRAFAIRTGGYNDKGQEIIRSNVVDAGGLKTKIWRAEVAHAASLAMERANLSEPLRYPVSLSITFTMPRPKNHYRTGKNAKFLKDNAPFWCTVKPDALKLARSTEDALTGIAFNDDKQVVDLRVTKHYGMRPGAVIAIQPLSKPLSVSGEVYVSVSQSTVEEQNDKSKQEQNVSGETKNRVQEVSPQEPGRPDEGLQKGEGR